MQSERVFAAARRGEGVWAEVANSNSKIESGEVTNRLRWLAMVAAMSGKLGSFNSCNEEEDEEDHTCAQELQST